MLGFHVKVQQLHSQLIITNPADILLMLGFTVFTLIPLLNWMFERPFPARKVIFLFLFTLFVYGYIIDFSQVILDKQNQTATVREFHWFHWKSEQFSTSGIAYAYLATGRASSRIVLQYEDGGVRSLSWANQMRGKPGAVLAINQYLGREPDGRNSN